MKTLKFFFALALLSCIVICCKKKLSIPEPYSSYISLEIAKPIKLASDTGTTIRIYLKNDSSNEFEKECIMTYTLLDTITGDRYTSENSFYSKRNPNNPNFVLSIPIKGSQFSDISLRDLLWKNLDFKSIKPNKYVLSAQLFIKDPYSPMNLIQSNKITVIK